MKQLWIYLATFAFITSCQHKVETKNEQIGPTVDTVKTSSGISIKTNYPDAICDTVLLNTKDTALIMTLKPITDDIGDKRKEYPVFVVFPNKKWPMLSYNKGIGAELYLLGDLDGDNLPELLLRPEWFSSCWASINLYSLKENKWKLLKTGNMYFCSDQYPLSKRVIKTEKGYALLTDSLVDDKFITLKKEIKFK